MHGKAIQIVSFDNPYPPNYGGVIDVFYKIKALSDLGVKVYLHAFYDDRTDVSGLKPYCENIILYKRNKGMLKHFSILPYMVNTRFSKELIINLEKSDAPILFESVRTTSVLRRHIFKQKTAVRCHNIEHNYIFGLCKSERNLFKKLAFYIEGYKLNHFERIYNKVDYLFPLAFYEQSYFNNIFKAKSTFIPVFQGGTKVESLEEFGEYALFHGDLSISDNIKSALFLVDVFKGINEPLIIASSKQVPLLIKKIKNHKHISFQLVSDDNHLNELIKNAQINVLYSFQQSGTKLKVFNALFKGRHCILNKNMIDDQAVLDVCHLAENKIEYENLVKNLFKMEFKVTKERREALSKYDAKHNAKELIELMC
ncbi:hypothetical protein AAFN75_02450 [Algibacter sp. AS12]|uniref:hypothetical protein n=1 Tax=Algibacter sp. AS12 TaxID=3135773 RepID=UPI00398B6ED2